MKLPIGASAPGVPVGVIRADRKMKMNTGTVKWFNATKGFGFIQPEDGGKDVFVHISDVQRSGLQGLNEGQRVSYQLQTGPQGKVSATQLQAA